MEKIVNTVQKLIKMMRKNHPLRMLVSCFVQILFQDLCALKICLLFCSYFTLKGALSGLRQFFGN